MNFPQRTFRSPATRGGTEVRRGFTMLEVTIVVVIIALFAAMMVPRFAGARKREFRLLVDQVVDLMTMYAQRDQLQQQTVGLVHDLARHELRLVILVRNFDGGEETVWRLDPYVTPIKLPEDVTIADVTADGDPVDIADFALASSPTSPRPSIVLVIQSPEETATITLPAHAITPVASTNDGQYAGTPKSIDLDRAGRGREEW